MFNHGIREVQELLKDNGCPEAEFNVGYLTAFSVLVRDGVDGTQDGTQDDTQGDTQDDTPDDTQDDTQDVTQDVPQGVTQGVPQDDNLDAWIEKKIRQNPKITTDELAKLSNKGIATIKRHIAKMPHIRYVGSGYSGHWEITEK